MRGFWAETVRRVRVDVSIRDDDPATLSFETDDIALVSRLSFDRYDRAFAKALETLSVRLRLQGEAAEDGSLTAVLGAVLDFSGLPAPPSLATMEEDSVVYPLGTLWRGRPDRLYPGDDAGELADMLHSLLQLPVRTRDQVAVEALLASV